MTKSVYGGGIVSLGLFIGCWTTQETDINCSLGKLSLAIRDENISCEKLWKNGPLEERQEYLQLSDSINNLTYELVVVRKKGLSEFNFFSTIINEELKVRYSELSIIDTVSKEYEGKKWNIISYSDLSSKIYFVEAYSQVNFERNTWILLNLRIKDSEDSTLVRQIENVLSTTQFTESK